jgi:hypothetical protein
MVTTGKSGVNDQKEYFKGVPPAWVLYSIVLHSFNAGVFVVNGLRHLGVRSVASPGFCCDRLRIGIRSGF